MDMSVTFDPLPSFNPEEPVRVEVYVPLDIVAYFDPAAAVVPMPDPNIEPVHQDILFMIGTKSVALPLARKISTALFGSTEAVPEPFPAPGLWRRTGGPPEAVSLFLDYRVEKAGLNPAYFYISASLVDGEVVFRTTEVTGERRKLCNEVEDGRMLGRLGAGS
jgi:hypothetical protein